MLMDQVTEILSHMIGIFHTTLEEERMRDVYEKFQALKKADPDNDPLSGPTIEFRAKYTLEGFNPGLKYIDQAPASPAQEVSQPFFMAPFYPLYNPALIISPPEETPTFQAYLWGFGGRFEFTVEPPSSVAVITLQSSYLSDNDTLFLGRGEASFVDTVEFLEQQLQLELIGTAIAMPIVTEIITPGDAAAEQAISLHTKISQVDVSPLTGVATFIAFGADAYPITINGKRAEDLPALNDLMPEYHQEEDAAEDTPETGTAAQSDTTDAPEAADDGTIGTSDPDHEFPDPFDTFGPEAPDDRLYDPVEEGNHIVMGGNTLVNEVMINASWLDAPVISVMGDVVDLDVIVQVNVLIDLDYGATSDLMPSKAVNAAAISFTATTLDPEADPEPEAASETTESAAYMGLPAHWAVTRIDGDLIQFNQTIQYSFVSDFDTAEITVNTNDTYIAMGDNTVLNLTSLAEVGYGFDLIMVGGNMISINWISQLNVMLDNDTMTYSGTWPAHFSGSDNLLYNGATIDTTGVDAYGAMTANFEAASQRFAEGADDLSPDVAQDSVFEGTEILRVLYIEGDLTTINWIDQTNVLGDSDQVHLAMQNVEGATGLPAVVTAGSNASINVATLNQYGTDSNVFVGGDVYDDALLYQAELIDTNAMPTGVDLPALTNEAVVFLADHMVTPENSSSVDTSITPTNPESANTPDIMQSMLA